MDKARHLPEALFIQNKRKSIFSINRRPRRLRENSTKRFIRRIKFARPKNRRNAKTQHPVGYPIQRDRIFFQWTGRRSKSFVPV